MAISDKDYYAMFGVDIGTNKMYESPLNRIYKDITNQIVKQDEDNCIYAVNQAVEYKVDKQELIKALQYDRNQYEKGYADAKNEFNEKLEQIRAEIESRLQGVNITLEILVKDDALIPRMEAAKTTLEEVLDIFDKAIREVEQ